MNITVTFPKKRIIIENNGGGGGTPGSGTGDMLQSVYDPTGVGGDAFDMDNMTEGDTAKILTTSERSNIFDAYGHSQTAHAPSGALNNVSIFPAYDNFPIVGVANIIYIAADTDKSYRWTASNAYALIASPLALGDNSTEAYRGDLGKRAYEHSQTAHAPSNAEENVQSDWGEENVNSDAHIKRRPTILALGDKSTEAYRGDRGKIAYDHSQAAHAPSNAQKNSDITKQEIEAKLTGELTSHSHAAAERGFAVNIFSARSYNPVDNTTVYFSNLAYSALTNESLFYLHILKNCTLKIANINCFANTSGSNEDWSLYVRKNGADDTLIATIGISSNNRIFANPNLNIAITAGDYLTIKVVNPTWATNPADVVFGGYLYFQLP